MVKRNFKYLLFSFMLMLGLLLCWSSYKLIKLSSLSSSDIEEIVPNNTAFRLKPDGNSEVTEDELVYDLIRKGGEGSSTVESVKVDTNNKAAKEGTENAKVSQENNAVTGEVLNDIKGIDDLINSVDNIKVNTNKALEKSSSVKSDSSSAKTVTSTSTSKKKLKPVTSSNYKWQVQFGTSGNEVSAREKLDKTIKSNRNLFNGVDVVLLKSESGGRQIWRLRTSGFETQAKANEFCSKLEANNISCFVTAK